MSDQTIVDVVINDSTATVVDNRDLSNLTIDLNATGQLLTNNLISSGNYLDSEIAIVSGIAQSGSNESLTGQINQLSGNLITTGQTLQTQITSNDSDINTLTTNLATTGETLTSEINSISGVVPTGGATNQVLAKINSANYNTQWVDQSGGGGGSGTVTSSTATTNYLTKWTNGAGEVIGNSVAYDNGSNVGIGTASPSAKLHVLTSGGSTTSENVVAIFQANTSSTILSGGGTAIKFKGVSSGGNQQNYDQGMISTFGYSTNNMHGMKFYYKPNSSTALTEGMRLNSSGFLSVGGQDASEKLHVFGGNIAVDNTYTIGGVNGSTGLSVSGSTLTLKTGNVARAEINNDKFTIGGTVYSSLATVFNVKDSQDSSFNSGIGVFRSSGAEATYINMVGGNFNLNVPTGASTQFKVAGTNTLTILANGSVGIGTTSPSSKLHVYGGDANINTLNIGLGAGSNNTTNTSIGVDSLSNNTIGVQNVAVGYQTLLNNTEGLRNVSIGYQSLYTNTVGDSNISIGYKSLHFNVSGLQNISIGDLSLFNNTGSSNTAIGFSALKSNTSGNSNSSIGFNSLLNNTTGTRNTAQGFEVLHNNTTGGNNVASGYKSIYGNTSGTFNVASGYLSLYANTTGSNNVAIGYQAGRFITDGSTANTTGDYNVFLGTDTKALADNDQNEIVIGYNTTGLGSNSAVLGNDSITKTVLKGNVGIGTTNPSSKLHVSGGDANINTLNIGLGAGTNNSANTSIGLSALSSNTSGANNTAVGEYALRGSTVGINNAAFGSRALYNNTGGNNNTATGHYALYSNRLGNSNAAFGLGALRNTNGSNNTAIGFYSLYRNSTGTYNVANGFEAGHYITDGSTFNSTGDYNIFIGANTKALADNDQNEIVIGYNATGAGSNSATLGNDSVTKTVLKGAVEFKVSGSNTFAVATNGSISSSTGASLSSGGTWTDASTRELKQDIKDLEYRESLNIIKQLNPVKFAYKKDPKNKKIGFIAEDVPDLVATEDRKGLSALQIVSALTKVVQSQQKEIQQLKRMVKRLNKIK